MLRKWEHCFISNMFFQIIPMNISQLPLPDRKPYSGIRRFAVHPEDERYQKFIGRKVLVPILNRAVPVIADEYVTREFGTGALKITPAHDPNDYALALKHSLEMISIMDESAHINENGGPYAGHGALRLP